jgi:RNA polymerase sigma factor (sigma-70 family)
MAARPLHKTLEPLRQLAASQFFADWPDQRLLERFLAQRDQTAFAELLQRHRRLVWGVCRHLLGHEQDAEDAFQATFLVLALKGQSIRKTQALSSWLHGVAYRCAMQIKRQETRRQRREQDTARAPFYDPARETNVRDLAALLQTEVQRLPEKHRAPFILCCLEGKSREEAARALGWKAGTVSGRLARARQELQQRLARMGIPLAAASAAAAIAEADVSAAVMAATARGVLAAASGAAALSAAVSPKVLGLVKGVTQAMLLTKIKSAAFVVLLIGLMAGVGVTAQQVIFKNGAAPPKTAAREKQKEPPTTPTEAEPDQDLRYDGKPFEYWRSFMIKELKPERRIDAIRAMGAFGVRGYSREATEVIVKLMKEYQDPNDIYSAAQGDGGPPDQKVVAEAYNSLRKIGPAAAPVLLKNLDRPNLRLFAVIAFCRGVVALPDSALPAVVRLIADGKDKLASAALEILSRGHPPTEEQWKAVAAFAKTESNAKKLVRILTLVVAENPPVTAGIGWPGMWRPRDVAAYFLGGLGERAHDAGPVLLNAALEGRNEQALAAVLQVKADQKTILSLASAAIKNGKPSSQEAAAKLLTKLGTAAKPAVPALLTALASTKHDAVGAACGSAILHALEKIGPDKDQITPALAKILEDNDQVWSFQLEAFGLLLKTEPSSENLVPTLAGYLKALAARMGTQFGPSARVQAHELMAVFQKLGPKAREAMPALLHVFKHADQEMQLATISTWTKMGAAARDALPALYQLLASTEKNATAAETRKLRQAATAAIQAISK